MNFPKLIINADDFGYNHSVNMAVVSCFEKEIINSTTLMANMEGFEEAIQMANHHHLKNKIGLHLNLTEGTPLTDMSGTGLVDNDGKFIMGVIFKPLTLIPSATRRKIKKEIRAQYDKLVANGIIPTHIDSHQHVHTLPLLASIFIDLAKEKNQRLRLAWVFKRKNFFKTGYYVLLNNYLKRGNLHFTEKFATLSSFENHLLKNGDVDSVFEIMVHPAYKEDNLIDILNETDIEQKTNRVKQLYLSKFNKK